MIVVRENSLLCMYRLFAVSILYVHQQVSIRAYRALPIQHLDYFGSLQYVIGFCILRNLSHSNLLLLLHNLTWTNAHFL